MKTRTRDAIEFVAKLFKGRIPLWTPERSIEIRPGTTTLPKELQRVVIVRDCAGLPMAVTKKACDSVIVSVCQEVSKRIQRRSGRRGYREYHYHEFRQQRIREVRQAIVDCGLTPGYVNGNSHEEWKFQIILPEGWQDLLKKMRKLATEAS